MRERKGHTEAAVEFCRLAGKKPVGVICELIDDGVEVHGGEGVEGDERRRGDDAERIRPEMTGSGMLRRDGCINFARRWGLRVCTIEALVEYLEGAEKVGGGLGER